MEAAEACVTRPLDLEYVSNVLRTLLIQTGRPIILEDKANGASVIVPPDSAAAIDGLLPIFLSAGEALWCDATGQSFGLLLEKDLGAYFSWRVKEIGAGKFSALLLAVMEAISQATTEQGIMAAELGRVFDDAVARIQAKERRSR